MSTNESKELEGRTPHFDYAWDNPHGQVGREFKVRTFSAGSILTLRKRIEPLASMTSVERTPRKMQSTEDAINKTHASRQKSVGRCVKSWSLVIAKPEISVVSSAHGNYLGKPGI